MDKQEKIIEDILKKEKTQMMENLKYYDTLPGKYAGKIRINRKKLMEKKNIIKNSKDAYPTKLAYILNINPTEYNKKYPGQVMYENMKMKAYSILYLQMKEQIEAYDEDISYNIGLDLILKEYIDKNPQLKDIITINK